jgi:hypothetical protein
VAQAGIAALAFALLLGALLGFGVMTAWLERGSIPSALLDRALPLVVWFAVSVLLRSFGALAASVQLFRQRRSGRVLATVVIVNDALVTALGPALGMGEMSAMRMVAFALCLAAVGFLWSPPGVAAADR